MIKWIHHSKLVSELSFSKRSSSGNWRIKWPLMNLKAKKIPGISGLIRALAGEPGLQARRATWLTLGTAWPMWRISLSNSLQADRQYQAGFLTKLPIQLLELVRAYLSALWSQALNSWTLLSVTVTWFAVPYSTTAEEIPPKSRWSYVVKWSCSNREDVPEALTWLW